MTSVINYLEKMNEQLWVLGVHLLVDRNSYP